MSRKQNKKIANYIRVLCLSGALVAYSASAYAVVANNTLPTNGQWLHGGSGFINKIENGKPTVDGNVLNVIQNGQNAVIQWGDFSIGANATVNFSKDGGGQFNILNYVDSGKVSEIYGAMNAKDGNVFVANTAGIVIGKSAQINVGSLYMTNKTLDESKFSQFNGSINDMFIQNQTPSAAELMSLGNINASCVTFDGDRVVLDTDRLSYNDGKAMAANDIIVRTNNDDNIVIGYSAYDAEKKTYAGKNNGAVIATVNDKEFTKADGYMWVKSLEQLQAMNTNLKGNYALNNSIDAIPTQDWNKGDGFISIGDNAAFSGKFDGVDYSIFGLTIKGTDNVGLFGNTNGATISNVTLVNGSIVGTTNVGAVVGNAKNTTIENAVSSAHVIGEKNVGGIVGSGNDVTLNGLVNTGTIKGYTNVGGLAGNLVDSELETMKSATGSYNLGSVTGMRSDGTEEKIYNGEEIAKNGSSNIGGLVGNVQNSTLGSKDSAQIFNNLDVQGGHNVGGIVGNMKDSTVTNAANNGNITATGYTNENYIYHSRTGEISLQVNIANVGGIAGNVNGSTISNVENTGDIKSVEVTKNSDTFSVAGNVGGIAGRAENTNIVNAENKENEILGAHNVGGIAGYFGGTWGSKQPNSKIYAISDSINNGGDIMATGARKSDFNTAEENVIKTYNTISDQYIIGNMGGIAGYMYGDNTQIKNSSNRGLVHSQYINENDSNNIKNSSKASNSGGIVGKIDRQNTASIDELKKNAENAAVVDSYNTGSVHGYANLGGIAGMMYNGEIVRSYNAGNIRSTRKPAVSDTSYTPVNMGGIVGDSTENVKDAHISLYDVYNRGELGDKEFIYGSRHVGGVVGRLSGDIDTAYNKGNIYNTMIVNGGIAGWWVSTSRDSSIKNVFNTGNITLNNRNHKTDPTSVGGIVGGTGQRNASGGLGGNDASLSISNAYNLGVIRSFNEKNINTPHSVGGIVGTVSHGTLNLSIQNVYTTGELYTDNNTNLGSIYGTGKVDDSKWQQTDENIQNAYYIEPTNSQFTNLAAGKNTGDDTTDGQAIVVKNADKDKANSYAGLFDGNPSDTTGDWRIYDGTTPILNAFLPKLAEGSNLNDKTNVKIDGGDKVQYGTAYNPFATIITTTGDKKITVDDSGAGAIGNVDSIIVNGGSLTVNNATNTGNTMYNGILYADGALTLEGGNISLGSISNLYGSSVSINAAGELKAYGDITATGSNGKNGVTLNASGDIEILGAVTAKGNGEKTEISGIGNAAEDKIFADGAVADPSAVMPDVGGQYKKDVVASANGNVTITSDNGDVNINYGNLGRGYINSSSDVTITGKEAYIDSDLKVGGNLNINADTTVLDISNIGKVQAAQNGGSQVDYLHGDGNFLDHFSKDKNENSINFKNSQGEDGTDAMITVDMWDYEDGQFNLKKYDAADHTLSSDLTNLKVTGTSQDGEKLDGKKMTYIWIADSDQLAGVQNYRDNIDKNSNILKYNFALKNDIDASKIGDNFNSIGSTKDGGFAGTFDGRGNRIVGLNTQKNTQNSALFDVIAKGGKVKDVNIYSFNITQSDSTSGGVIANTNNGTIDGINAFGNSVTGSGNVGGVVGTNNGTIQNTVASSVVENTGDEAKGAATTVGGIAGTNHGKIIGTESNSAVTSKVTLDNPDSALGGIAGINGGTITNVFSKGVTTGLYDNQPDAAQKDKEYKTSVNVGGIAGINKNIITGAYNESITSGFKNVGGVVGVNEGKVENLANATYVYGGDMVGGVAGTNNGIMTNGRNNGEIIGGKNIHSENKESSQGTNVGGLVGVADLGSHMENLTNDMSASITGHTNVGGLIGHNKGELTSGHNLMNSGIISGVKNVGGSIGRNSGKVTNINTVNKSNVEANTAYANSGDPEDKKYENFGGVIGLNDGTASNMSNSADVNLNNATTVQGNVDSLGGIIGKNTGAVSGVLLNGGNVTGDKNVGGIIGTNEADISNATLINGAVVKTDDSGKTYWEEHQLKQNIVKGTENVGGVVGNNSKSITKSNVINAIAGTISGTTNIGGLIGTNTGLVRGDRDANDQYYKYQVYNNGTVNGNESVGGLVGENSGSLVAGYNTGASSGAGAVGNNSGKVDQVFSTTDNGVVGNGSTGTVKNSYYVNSDGQQIVDKTDSDVWKQYNGQKNNLLAVFLTKAKVEINKDFNVTYDGEEHKFSAGKYNKDTGAVEILYDGKPVGTITVKDPNAVHSLLDYDNQKEFNNLIQGITVQNADKYKDFLYSEQINTGDKSNPNNLGFNFVTGFETEPGDTPSFEIAKKQLTITLDEIFRKYGSLDSWYKETDKGWSVEGLVDKDKNLSQDISMKVTGDNSVTGKDSGRVTENANGDYTWSADFKLGDDIGTNYEIKGGIGTEHEAISLSNKAHVEKVDLHINVDDKNIAKGQVPDYSGSINMGDIVNGDNVSDLSIGDWGISADNGKLIYEVGTHEGVLGLWIADKFYDINTVNSSEAFTNYKLILDPGTLTVTNDEYQFWEAEDKYAWSKKREERERKAEVYFERRHGTVSCLCEMTI